jgi:hypothetical protein
VEFQGIEEILGLLLSLGDHLGVVLIDIAVVVIVFIIASLGNHMTDLSRDILEITRKKKKNIR